MKRTMVVLFLVAFTAGCGYQRVQIAQPGLPQPDMDPPSRVLRLSYIQGTVSLRPAGDDKWSAASLNRPLSTADSLWTEPGGRAELHMGSVAIRLAANTSLAVQALNDSLLQLKLTSGSLVLRVRSLDENESIEIDTPAAAVSILRTGLYRIDAGLETNDVKITVRSGQAEAGGGNQAFTVRGGEQARVSGTAEFAREIQPAPPADDFDRFSMDRDRGEDERAGRTSNVPAGVIGREDLADHGDWRVHPEWGAVWAPRVLLPDWAPYRYGHWIWVDPWGWVWVDDAPWGFAPFHYGRWLHWESRWYWVPPPPRLRPIWAPALVVFVGGGRPDFRIHFWIGFSGVAWFPLGPREVYIPPYRGSHGYINRVNIHNTVILNQTNIYRTDMSRQAYRNRSVSNAITAVARETFATGRPVQRGVVRIDDDNARGARPSGAAPPVAPTRESISGGAARSAPPPAATTRRGVVTRRTAPSSPPAFEQRRQSLERYPGRASAPTPTTPREDVRQNRQWDKRSQQIEKERQREQPPSSRQPSKSRRR